MHGQLDLEEVFNKCKSPERPSNFHEFWSEEVHYDKNWGKKKTKTI
jgi:hypothetical protein